MRKAICLAGLFALATALFAADPFVGMWKLNAAKSTGVGVPKEANVVTEENGETEHSTITATAANGRAVSFTIDYPKAGGKGQISGDDRSDGISVKRSNDNTLDTTFMKAGKAIRTTHSVIAKDGKSMITTVKVLNNAGKTLTWKEVLDKQ
jgi:hypothetical protein